MKDLYEKVEALIGKPFPFKTGEVVKFPNEKLSKNKALERFYLSFRYPPNQ